MSIFRGKLLLAPLLLAGLFDPAFTKPACAETPGRGASFTSDTQPASAAAGFSGLAAPVAETPLPAPVEAAPSGENSAAAAGSLAVPADNFGSDIWTNDARQTAAILLPSITVTGSAALNGLLRRLVDTSDGQTGEPDLTDLRIEKMLDLGAASAAWSQAQTLSGHDALMHRVAGAGLSAGDLALCATLPSLASAHPGADWREDQLICAVRDQPQTAQALLEALRNGPARDNAPRDDIFIEAAQRTISADKKPLPGQLTPLTPALLALLKLNGQALPSSLYGHPDPALAAALAAIPSRPDTARLTLAEKLAANGLMTVNSLSDIYKSISFVPGEVAAPLTANEAGARLRALLFQAAAGHDVSMASRIADADKMLESTPPALLTAIGPQAASMLGDAASDPALTDKATLIAQIYMLAGQGDLALEWYRLAARDTAHAALREKLWPQFVLAGLEADKDFSTDLTHWLDALLAGDPAASDRRATLDAAEAALLLLDATGFAVSDEAWNRMLAQAGDPHRVSLAPVLLARLQSVAKSSRAEIILLSAALAQGNEISLPAAVEITRALRIAGFKSDAALFARQYLTAVTP